MHICTARLSHALIQSCYLRAVVYAPGGAGVLAAASECMPAEKGERRSGASGRRSVVTCQRRGDFGV